MPFLFIGIPLAVVMILNIFKWKNYRTAFWVALGVTIFQMGLACFDLYRCLFDEAVIQSAFFGKLSVDLFSAVVLLIIGFIGFVSVIVAMNTVHSSRFSFGSVTIFLIMGMSGCVMVTDIFSLYVFIEVTAAASFLLIAIEKEQAGLEGAFKYYLMSALSATMMLIAIALIFMETGDTSFFAVSDYISGYAGNGCAGQYSPAFIAAIILIISSLCIKSGVVPFHTWVPDAHSSAPSPVSVILAGIVIKVSGVYALMRVYRDVLLCDVQIGKALFILAVASIIVGALGAMGQNDIKRMLAFSSVSQIGYIILGVATGSYLGYLGAMMHFFNHATFKSLLFVNSTVIMHQTGTRDMTKMGGLSERMPITGISSVLGLLSMAGIPPLSGFWSKLIILIAVWQISAPFAVTALCASVLTLGYFLILQRKVFFGKLAPGMEDVHEDGHSMQFIEILLSGINVLAGCLFPLLLVFMQGRGVL
jgi:multicomponent Na+:H+ antiporter subunit D